MRIRSSYDLKWLRESFEPQVFTTLEDILKLIEDVEDRIEKIEETLKVFQKCEQCGSIVIPSKVKSEEERMEVTGICVKCYKTQILNEVD